MTQWYYAQNGQQKGPMTFDELHNLAGMGALAQGDLVWNASMKDWVPAGSVNGLFNAPISTSPGEHGVPAVDLSNPYAAPGSAWQPQAIGPDFELFEEIPPGSEPIGVFACLQRGFELTKKHFLVLFLGFLIIVAISIAVSMPFSIAQAFSQAANPQAHVPPAELMENPAAAFQWGVRQQLTPIYFIQQAISLVASSFLFAGYYRICLNVASNRAASPGMLFGEGNKTARVLGISILLSIPNWIGYLAFAMADIYVGAAVFLVMLLIGFVMWLRLGFAAMAVVDRDLSLADALKYSLSITRNNTLPLFGLAILAVLIAMLGAIACGIGMFFTVPVALMGITVAYRWMQYGRRVVEAPVTVVNQ